jgi:hypothetical protein
MSNKHHLSFEVAIRYTLRVRIYSLQRSAPPLPRVINSKILEMSCHRKLV